MRASAAGRGDRTVGGPRGPPLNYHPVLPSHLAHHRIHSLPPAARPRKNVLRQTDHRQGPQGGLHRCLLSVSHPAAQPLSIQLLTLGHPPPIAKSYCPYCKKAKAVLGELKLPAGKEIKVFEYVLYLSPSRRVLPSLAFLRANGRRSPPPHYASRLDEQDDGAEIQAALAELTGQVRLLSCRLTRAPPPNSD